MDVLTIDKEIKIRSVKKIWEEIDKAPLPLELDFSQFEKFDCAGFQLLLYLLKLGRENPDSFKISGLKDSLGNLLLAYGYNLNKGEHK